MRHGDRVLDVACGTGIVARTVAPIVGSTGAVIGADLSGDMLAEATKHVPDGVNLEWRQGDAEHLAFDDEDFDVVFCQQALQYFPDRAAAVSEKRSCGLELGRWAGSLLGDSCCLRPNDLPLPMALLVHVRVPETPQRVLRAPGDVL